MSVHEQYLEEITKIYSLSHIVFISDNEELPLFELSTYYIWPMVIDGKLYPSVEHFYQSKKFIGSKHYSVILDKILGARDPITAVEIAALNNKHVRGNWQHVKYDVMECALWYKFTTSEQMRDLLLSTGNTSIVKHNLGSLATDESYWSDGYLGQGKNMYGDLLMKIRNKLETTA